MQYLLSDKNLSVNTASKIIIKKSCEYFSAGRRLFIDFNDGSDETLTEALSHGIAAKRC